MKKILAYAFGPTLDHVIRVAGVVRRLVRYHGVEGHILTNHTLIDRDAYPGLHWYECPLAGPSIVAKLREMIIRVKPMLFLVDAFPMGADGELVEVLPEFHCWKALLQSALPPEAYLQHNLPDFTAKNYQACIAPQDVLPYAEFSRSLAVDPLTFYQSDEIIDEVDAKLSIGYSGRPIIVFCDAVPGGVRLFDEIRRRCTSLRGLRIEWRIHTNDPMVAQRYGAGAIAGASFSHLSRAMQAVIAPAGYGYYHEAVMNGVSTLFIPSNHHREQEVERAGQYVVRDLDHIVQLFQQGALPKPPAQSGFNGSATAAKYLSQLIGYRTRREPMAV